MELSLEDLKNYVQLAREGAYLGKYTEAMSAFKNAIEMVLEQTKIITFELTCCLRFKVKMTEQCLKQACSNFEQELQSELEIIQELQAINQGFKNVFLGKSEEKCLVGLKQNNIVGEHHIYHLDEVAIPLSQQNERNCFRQLNKQFIGDNFQPSQNGFEQCHKYGPSTQTFNNNGSSPSNENNCYYGNKQENEEDCPRVSREGYFNQIDPEIWPIPQETKQNKAQKQKKVGIQNHKHLNSPQNNNAMNQKDKKRDYPKPWQKNAQDQHIVKKKGANENGKKKSYLHYVYPEGSGPDSDLISMLERDVVDQNPNIDFDQIAELEKAKDMLQEAVLLPILIPQYFRGIRRPLKGILMFGPPGTGKTMLAKAVAATGKMTFFNVSASSLASKWRGDSEKLVRILFEMARYYSPSTIFFDEIDAIGSKRVDGECEANRKMKAEMLIQIDGVSSSSTEEKDRKQVMVLAATNRPWDMDEALRRRLEKRILIPLPSTLGRMQLFKLNMQGINYCEDLNWDYLVKNTEGFSGADISCLCREASFMPMRRKLNKLGGFKNIDNIEDLASESEIPLTQQDFEEALRNVNKSVSGFDLDNFEKWMTEFGSV